ncbi:MAG: 3-deoxy-7-phosphoheptulonate synthase [Polyangiales bacterium]
MIVSLHDRADAEFVRRELAARGLWATPLADASGKVRHFSVACVAQGRPRGGGRHEGVAGVASLPKRAPRVDAQGLVVDVGGVKVGGGAPVFSAAVRGRERGPGERAIAARVAKAGAKFLRGGAFKPRTSPYAFQGHGDEGLRWLRAAGDAHGLKVVTEAMGEVEAPRVAEWCDVVQVGSRNMQNFSLLKALGRCGRPVLLKRAMSATVEEWLLAGEYLLSHGAPGVIFCERGIRGFDDATRNLLDLGAVALLSTVYGLPVVVDPSHATGRRDLVLPLARAALAAGAAGVMIETHDDPGRALSDGPQALTPAELDQTLRALGATRGDTEEA